MAAIIVMIISPYFKRSELSDLDAIILSVNYTCFFCFRFCLHLSENKFLKGLSLYFLII